MNTRDYIDFFDELDDEDELNEHLKIDTRRPYGHMSRKLAEKAQRFKQEQVESCSNFKFTYKPARFEEWWLLASLGDLYEHQWIADVLRRVKGGKEASVYQCRPGAAIKGGLMAAKVYRPWSLRDLRNNGMYSQSRADLDTKAAK